MELGNDKQDYLYWVSPAHPGRNQIERPIENLITVALIGIVFCALLRVILFVTEIEVQTAKMDAARYELQKQKNEALASELVLQNEKIRNKIFRTIETGEHWEELK